MQHFLYMSGYGTYIWSAYGIVLITLFTQWILPWRRWKKSRSSQAL